MLQERLQEGQNGWWTSDGVADKDIVSSDNNRIGGPPDSASRRPSCLLMVARASMESAQRLGIRNGTGQANDPRRNCSDEKEIEESERRPTFAMLHF